MDDKTEKNRPDVEPQIDNWMRSLSMLNLNLPKFFTLTEREQIKPEWYAVRDHYKTLTGQLHGFHHAPLNDAQKKKP
jgi:hypothetical protein